MPRAADSKRRMLLYQLTQKIRHDGSAAVRWQTSGQQPICLEYTFGTTS